MLKFYLSSIFKKLFSDGFKSDSVKKPLDFRWSDPQDEKQGWDYLLRRIQLSAQKGNVDCICLIGPDIELANYIESLVVGEYLFWKFSSVEELVYSVRTSNLSVLVGISSLSAKQIHQLARELLKNEETSLIPIEYAVIPKLENQLIDKMWEDSKDFISPLCLISPKWETLFKESCELFEPKMGIRDFMDLIQGLQNITSRNLAGNIAEFGSFRGQSGYLIARFLESLDSERKLFMFDMFDSFPVEIIGVDHFWSKTHEVDFAEIKEKFVGLKNIEFVKGDFTTTFENSNCGKLALVFVDCDSFRGTDFLINKIFDDYLIKGGVMIFEDYGHACLLGNRLAVHKGFDNRQNAFCFFSQFSGSYIVCKTH
tara:strand:+ start:3268 stop:4374 length:1107 start_codon:yes stop_codon:yes gene_type:complete